MYRIIICALVSLSVLGTDATFDDCGSKLGKFTSVTVSNCDPDSSQCILKRGTNATIQIQFTVDEDVSNVNAVVHGILSGLPVPFPLQHPDACTDAESGIKCPLTKSNGPFTYTAVLQVMQQYPKLGVQVKWELQDEKKEDIVCILIPAKIQ